MSDAANHAKFLSHLAASDAAVWLVARWLGSGGQSVRIPPTAKAPTREEWDGYVDGGDLFLEKRVEVKHLSVSFTNRKDWPFKDKFIVCAKHSFDRASPKPYVYVILNQAKTHAAVVKGDTHKYWQVGTRKDSRYDNVEQEFYLCPMDQVQFATMPRSTT